MRWCSSAAYARVDLGLFNARRRRKPDQRYLSYVVVDSLSQQRRRQGMMVRVSFGWKREVVLAKLGLGYVLTFS
ncbi:hypothetical protein L596_025141 [Steinernema carpocapsae]|uniref:Uncharacterized protein n=1 Tax=Steinernema carpocapsae TaxID=34508 RepID=A0A4U5M701_STECR|nr:hypothetical protein L596_025141 [Steinernema carpocapsae]